MQKFMFPMEYLRVTQGEYSVYSHGGSMAIDFGGKDSSSEKLYAPCDMVVKRNRANANGEMYLESVEPVLFADGTSDYARLLCVHDSQFNVPVGTIIRQGQYFYDEGGMGSGNPNKFGIHVHLEGGKGKWKSTTQSPNSQGVYVIENQAHLYDLFFLDNSTIVLNDGGYRWVRDAKQEQINVAQLQTTIARLEAANVDLTMRLQTVQREFDEYKEQFPSKNSHSVSFLDRLFDLFKK